MQNDIFKTTEMNLKFKDGFFAAEEGQMDQDLIVFSHLRWDFVFQRPQHLLTRFAKERRVYFVEEPHFSDLPHFSYEKFSRENNVQVIAPYLPENLSQEETWEALKHLINQLLVDEDINGYTSWYYTPMALPFTRHLTPSKIIFDCMDELSAFKNAPALLIELESELLKKADIVFTGGQSLYEAKKNRHHNIHVFPSSIDGNHFRKSRTEKTEPDDQKEIPHPRIGFFGVIDERMDIELVDQISKIHPDWHFVLIGPTVKIDPAQLPHRSNIHYLGKKDYKDLPKYLSGWEVAMLPFARNESTRFISPTKTPEYLAAGRPVVSTSIQDVIRPYAQVGLISIADTAEDFVLEIEKAIGLPQQDPTWLPRVDEFLASMSWDSTYEKMADLEKKTRSSTLRPTFIGRAEAQVANAKAQLGN